MEEKELLTNYEITVVVPADVSEADAQKVIAKLHDSITKKGGSVYSQDFWGKQRLAYPINKHEFGYYATLVFNLLPATMAELANEVRMMPEILRHLLISLDKEGIKPGSLKRVEPFREQAAPRTFARTFTPTPRPAMVRRAPVAAVPKKDESERMKDLDAKLENILKEE
ncbi:MAG: 30S ribosomal protein S6 [bacterium]